ncbi:pantoate--beta-alanine ligase [Leucobacter denitrificans]|uniref:Pantothenate synthetase n=1 Tax=Leucobacter denitrificans TaxID=683042 RepID=A0A7G9S1Y2_9MICO|nr:pantoate--beta-alanine ligase [Leucobacter denitrificans]QNN61857.1 pantoate--beta-alanine ligase [Leucobacter denitrificans]
MRVVRTVAELRAATKELLAGAAGSAGSSGPTGSAGSIGIVPTMGALHEGHLSLVRAARADNAVVVVSIFVNPTQFNEPADLDAYPRNEERDTRLAADAGADIVFAPSAAEMYPEGFATTVSVTGSITETLEGASRGASHFDGVATIVAKLLLAALADNAYFGAKDAQQVVVVKRMVADLGIPARVVVCPTSRDADGLARSSRNVRLSAADRSRALAIPRALTEVAAAVGAGEFDPQRLRALATEILAAEQIEAEYLAFVDPESLVPVTSTHQPTLFALAARVGEVRLIDNIELRDGAESA